ncbi:hypothetical protein pdam_00015764, partial [Pocillopora damicornis]
MDDLHLSDFREMRLKSERDFDRHRIFCSNGHRLGCLFVEINTFEARALTGSSNTLKEQDNISPDHSSYSFPMKFGQNFKKLY